MVITNIGGSGTPPGVTFIDINTDDLVIVELGDIPGLPGGTPQHAWVTPDGKTVYLTLDASPPEPLNIIVLKVNHLDFASGVATLQVKKVIKLEEAGDVSSYPFVRDYKEQDGTPFSSQRIAGWTQPIFTQAHGPAFTPDFKYTYVTQWTDNKYRGLNVKSNTLISADPIIAAETSRQTHGLTFNPSGTRALATGYYYDHNEIDVWQPVHGLGTKQGDLEFLGSMILHDEGDGLDNCVKGDGAFTHYTTWVDDQYAYTATMQFDEVSIAANAVPPVDIVGPSIWLLDVTTLTADCVKGTATVAAGVGEDGVHLSASDILLVDTSVGRKLYIAEEDTLDGSFGGSGSVSVFAIDGPGASMTNPKFVKRLETGDELPLDFAIAHGLTKSQDGQFVYASSYASNYIIKIATTTDTVDHIFGPSDGLVAPHGGFVAGDTR